MIQVFPSEKSILYCICNIFPVLIVHCKYTNKKYTVFKYIKYIRIMLLPIFTIQFLTHFKIIVI